MWLNTSSGDEKRSKVSCLVGVGGSTCVGAEVKVGGVGAGHTVALPLIVGRGGRPGLLVEVFCYPFYLFLPVFILFLLLTWLKCKGHREETGNSHF